jgi:hypothetical protein
MPQPHLHRSGVLMARVWVEDDTDHGWRCRITRTADVAHAGEVSSVVSTPEQVFDAVREWLDRCEPGPGAARGHPSNE